MVRSVLDLILQRTSTTVQRALWGDVVLVTGGHAPNRNERGLQAGDLSSAHFGVRVVNSIRTGNHRLVTNIETIKSFQVQTH